jgi:hypothetical protein
MDEARRFRFRLALTLGMTVAELEAKMSVKELDEWAQYYALEPFGEERADYRNALNCLVAAKCNGNKNAKLDDFLLFKVKKTKKNDFDKQIVEIFLKV